MPVCYLHFSTLLSESIRDKLSLGSKHIFFEFIVSLLGGDAHLEQMNHIRDLQEKLSTLHFELEEEDDAGRRYCKNLVAILY